MMTFRSLALIGLATIIASCASKQPSEAKKLSESEVAIIRTVGRHGLLFNESHFHLLYVDGASIYAEKLDSKTLMTYRLLPGNHTLGVLVQYGNICLPIFPSACFNACYSGIKLNAEAGHTYSYDLEKVNDDVFLKVQDETGKLASKGLCEDCSYALCGPSQIKSVNEQAKEEPSEKQP